MRPRGLSRSLATPGRLGGIDLARALAVFGMLTAHLTNTEALDIARPETWSGIVDGRSSILFATLAGVSIALMSGGPRPVTGAARRDARARIAVRAGLIWTLGILLIAIGLPVYVILPAYGILFVLSLPLLGWSARWLFVLAAALAVTMPFVVAPISFAAGEAATEGIGAALVGWWYPFPLWLAFLVAGMGVGRLDLRRVGVCAGLFGTGVVLAVFGYGAAAVLGLTEQHVFAIGPFTTAGAVAPHSGGLFEAIGSGGFALAVIGACLLLCRIRVIDTVLWPLRAVGSMPLTIYVGQLLAWWTLALALGLPVGDLGGVRDAQPLCWFVLGSIVFACAWRLFVGRGPLEWVLAQAARVPELLRAAG